MSELELSRPTSPMTSSFCDATSTIDDLTTAIADLSRIPSPEPVAVVCCCGRENCGNLKSWLELKTKLNQRLVLSAEVGQALLQRHEAYVRQSERKLRDTTQQYSESEEVNGLRSSNENLHRDFDDLMKEKAQLEKRLNQALVNSEVTEVSSKTILQELQEARETISRLTAHHARSVGWETRLSAALRERDDMQQERDGEMHRARLAESRFAVLKEKTAKLQVEVRRLQDILEEKRLHRLESSEHLIHDAKTRLESFRNSQLGLTAKLAEEELTSVLESMVHDNEVLKHDNAELQRLLAESREEIHTLQEELEEQRVNPPPRISRSGANTPNPRHHHTGSVPTINLKDFMLSPPGHRNSAEGRRRSARSSISLRLSPALQEPATPDSMSLGSPNLADSKWSPFGQNSGAFNGSVEVGEDAKDGNNSTLYEKPRGHRPLLLLARSRGVQTESPYPGFNTPTLPHSNSSYISSNDLQSESSSVSESQSSHMGAILERVVALFNRISQADALTITNRLKRQHLRGADVGHISRSTVSTILAEVTGLRNHFRTLLEDEKTVTTCTRRDLRLFFKIIRDFFNELGQLRVTMNEVILDPSSAVRVSELALNPSMIEAEKGKENDSQSGATGWMAPISKLFLPSAVVKSDSGGSGDRGIPSLGSRTHGIAGTNMPRSQKFVPKLGPALAASATTVNVEFSGTGVGRAVTSTVRLQPTVSTPESMTVTTGDASSLTVAGSPGLMGIFAGAQKPIDSSEPWVVLPSGPRKKPSSAMLIDGASLARSNSVSTTTLGRSSHRRNTNRVSRNVDAIIDIVEKPSQEAEYADERDDVPPLLQRTLHRRGLSDSSIHSTFSSHGGEQHGSGISMPPSPKKNIPGAAAARIPAWRHPNSMFQAFSQWGMFHFKQPAHSATDAPGAVSPDASLRAAKLETPRSRSPTSQGSRVGAVSPSSDEVSIVSSSSGDHQKVAQPKPVRANNPNRSGGVLPNLTSWATSNLIIDRVAGSDPFIASSLRDESYIQRGRRIGNREDTPIRDFY